MATLAILLVCLTVGTVIAGTGLPVLRPVPVPVRRRP